MQGFLGGLLLRPNRAVLDRLNEVGWHSGVLGKGLEIALSAERSTQLGDDKDEDGKPET
jgi:hypothetical protein